MLTYCLKCKKDTEDVNSKVINTKSGRAMVSKCAVCQIKIYNRKGSKRIIK